MTKSERESQWEQLFMRFATDVANMSYAKRLKVGAVAVKDRRVVAIGFNGTPAGEDNNCEDRTPAGLVTKPNVIHAEDNLIRFAKENDIDLHDCSLYITHSPCPNCCEKVGQAGFSRVVFGKQFRDLSGLNMLKHEYSVEVSEWN